MKKTAFKWLIAIILLIGIFYGYSNFCKPSRPATDTVVKRVTILQTKVDTLFVTQTKTIEKPYFQRDTVIINNEDTIHQKQYNDTLAFGADTITAQTYVSGREAQLDSLRLQLRKAEITVTQEKIIEKEIFMKPPKRFKDRLFVAPSVGVGYGLVNKQPDVYIGVSAGIKLW